jgi:hypothetical protein
MKIDDQIGLPCRCVMSTFFPRVNDAAAILEGQEPQVSNWCSSPSVGSLLLKQLLCSTTKNEKYTASAFDWSTRRDVSIIKAFTPRISNKTHSFSVIGNLSGLKENKYKRFGHGSGNQDSYPEH